MVQLMMNNGSCATCTLQGDVLLEQFYYPLQTHLLNKRGDHTMYRV